MQKKTPESNRVDSKKLVRITIEVPDKLRKSLKAKIAAEGKTIRDTVCTLIEKYVNEGRNNGKSVGY